jgi:phage portal protein BeeE
MKFSQDESFRKFVVVMSTVEFIFAAVAKTRLNVCDAISINYNDPQRIHQRPNPFLNAILIL